MSKFRFADLDVEFKSERDRIFDVLFRGYEADFDETELSFNIGDDEVALERKLDDNRGPSRAYHAYFETAALRKVGEVLPFYNGAVLHSATFSVDGRGIAFGAFSGTGKTTHMTLWKEMLGERFQIINGDKPFVRFVDDKLYV